ncbi:MAG: monomeric [Selenomonadaceae bacterium]|nr:monomeric [FeFe] hydrogenase [Selenomonadaceae bacterium]
METTQVAKFRREVLTQIARYVWEGTLTEKIYDILQVVKEDGSRVRCCVHKERAVLKNRIQMALWQERGGHIVDGAMAAMAGKFDKSLPVMDVLPDACDACPIDKYYVTDLCRHCIQHKCMEHCPKHAISIQNDRATIDRDVCIECGRCAKSCPYGAIIEITRPCIKACALDAMSSGSDKRTVIDYDKCVSCGNCRDACPFGALDERSMIAEVVLAIKSGKKVVAMVAPSIIGQFGHKVTMGQIMAALKKIGFTSVVEVAVGADITTIKEAAEFKEKVPDKIPFMTSSCCPAFVEHVKKHFPDFALNISETPSPMVCCGLWVKSEDPNALTCFIGPCIAKKAETVRHPESVDFAMTYEELSCVFEGLDIDVTSIEAEDFVTIATAGGLGFPLNRGVQGSLKALLTKDGKNGDAILDYADGLKNCQEKLTRVKKGELPLDYFEGMACVNGCVDGPGTLAQQGVTRVLLTKFTQAAAKKVSNENEAAVKAAKG